MEATSSPGSPSPVDILILGAGWTSTFLLPLLDAQQITHAETTTTGRDGTICFVFDPAVPSEPSFHLLPAARTILITFPLKGLGSATRLTTTYQRTHPSTAPPQWMQLGSSGMFKAASPHDDPWISNSSPYDTTDPRAVAEDELLAAGGAALDLAGLYGGTRDPRDWLPRMAKSLHDVRVGTGSLHLVHGDDVARAVVAMHARFTPGRRWIVTDLSVYDRWTLFLSWGAEARRRLVAAGKREEAESLEYEQWVVKLMAEEGVRALPRDVGKLGRALDGTAFWREMGIWPIRTLMGACD